MELLCYDDSRKEVIPMKELVFSVLKAHGKPMVLREIVSASGLTGSQVLNCLETLSNEKRVSSPLGFLLGTETPPEMTFYAL